MSCNFMSCIFMTCTLVRHFHVPVGQMRCGHAPNHNFGWAGPPAATSPSPAMSVRQSEAVDNMQSG